MWNRFADSCLLIATALGAVALAPLAQAAPPKPAAPASCLVKPATTKGASLWLASNPHLPLAETRNGLLSKVEDKERCKRPQRWGAPGRSYRVLDRWGKVIGSSKVLRRERYDVSGCDEILMSAAHDTEEAQGDHLLVASDGAWAPGPSFADRPSPVMRADFRRFLSGLDERLLVKRPYEVAAEPKHIAFFRIGQKDCQPRDSEADAVGAYAVADGPYLVIARHDPKQGWKAVYLSSPLPAAGPAYHANKLLAIVDMDGDGVPEIVFHTSQDTAFWDVVLGRDAFQQWAPVAESAAGATN